MENVLTTASCTISQTSTHWCSGTLSNKICWMYLSLPLYNHKGLDFTCVKYINALFHVKKFLHRLSSKKYRKLYLLYGKYMKYSCLMLDQLGQILISESLKFSFSCIKIWKKIHMQIIEISYFIWDYFSQDFRMWNTQNSKSHNRSPSFKLSWWKYR